MVRGERRRAHQARPAEKANYFVITGLLSIVVVLLLKPWPGDQYREVFLLAGTIAGGLINFLNNVPHKEPGEDSDTSISAGNVENVTVQPERSPASAPANEVYYQDDGKTKELTQDRLRELGLRR